MYHFNVNVKIVIVFHFSISSNFLWEAIACTIYHLYGGPQGSLRIISQHISNY